MREIVKRAVVETPADEVWAIVGQFGLLPKWSPLVTQCRVEGSGVGAVRTLTVNDGAILKERMDAYDAGCRTYAYSVIDPGALPLKSWRSTVRVEPDGEGRSIVTWTGRFEVSGAEEADTVRWIDAFYEAGSGALRERAFADPHPAIAKWPAQAIT